MSMSVVLTRNMPGRFRGFLASCMLEVAPGVYVSPDMSVAVRNRLWQVMVDWIELIPTDGGILIIWTEAGSPSGLAMNSLGWPKTELVDHEGIWLALRPVVDTGDDSEEMGNPNLSTTPSLK